MRNLVKGNIDWHNTVNQNFEEISASLSEKANQSDIAQLSNPNLLINGDFQVWQRGTSFSNIGAQYVADRWKVDTGGTSGGATNSIIKQYDNVVGNYMRITTTSYANPFHFLEQQEIDKLKGKKVTLSFYARLVNGTFTNAKFMLLGNTIDANSIAAEWKRYSITAIVPADCTNMGICLPGFSICQNNLITVTWDIAQVKLELGSIATPFTSRLYAEELALCKRDYQIIRFGCVAYNSTLLPLCINFPVEMRTVPTVKISTSAGGSDGMVDAFGSGAINIAGYTLTNVKNNEIFYLINNSTTQFTAGRTYDGYVVLDAEIY